MHYLCIVENKNKKKKIKFFENIYHAPLMYKDGKKHVFVMF